MDTIRTDFKVPVIYVEGLRIDAYFSLRDIKRLKLLRDDYEFWADAVPQYRDLWDATRLYCDMKILEIDPRYLKKRA